MLIKKRVNYALDQALALYKTCSTDIIFGLCNKRNDFAYHLEDLSLSIKLATTEHDTDKIRTLQNQEMTNLKVN